ncbi:MAG: hypothetical protein PS018_11595 [bacterium]|nr:hypothetical protein [bacterium]
MPGEHFHTPVPDQGGPYNSAAHESLRAVVRCLMVNIGRSNARALSSDLLRFMGVDHGSQLSPDGAYYCRKMLERHLPLRGDYA